MMHQSVKRTAIAILVGLFLVSFSLPAFAAYQMPDITKTDCSITLSYLDKNEKPIQGGKFTLYRTASVRNDDNDLSYDMSGTGFEQSGVSLGNLEDANLAQQLAFYAEKNKLLGTTKSLNENGELKFAGLSVGLYLIVQAEHIAGYYDMAPFLIGVPMMNETGSDWNYHVNASPKGEMNPIPIQTTSLTVKKVWTENGKDRPESISVRLLRNDVAFDEVVLSDKNNWTYTWSELDGAYTWSVREINIPKGYVASYRRSGTDILITNTSSLIKTGQLNWPIPLLAESGIVLFVLGWILTFVKKEKKQR